MDSPLTNTLIKIFAKGFYRVNSGMLLFFCVTIGSSFLYIETAGHISLLSPEQILFYHFILVITFIASPLMTLIIFFLWLLYAIKSWSYVVGQLGVPNNQFLFYSVTATDKVKQFKSWFCVQLFIFIPIICYWFFAIAAGIYFHHYILPFIMLLYIFALLSVSAFLFTFLVNRLIDGNQQSYLIQLASKWRKSYFSIFIYHVFDRMKVGYAITKIVSLIALIGVLNSFTNLNTEVSVAGIIILSAITTHSFLIYREHHFMETQMSFARNLPYSRTKLFLNFCGLFLLLIIPESIWLLTKFNLAIGSGLLLFGLSVALLFRSVLYWFGLSMFKYVRWVFCSYILLFELVLFRFIWVLIPLLLMISFIVFYKNYYNQKMEIKS